MDTERKHSVVGGIIDAFLGGNLAILLIIISLAAGAAALARLRDDSDLRKRLGAEARRRAVAEFDYDHLARMLHEALVEAGG